MNKFLALTGLAVVVGILIVVFAVGNNTLGYRVTGQYITGHTYVKFEPGPYMKWFGKSQVWPNEITYDYDKIDNPEETTLEQKGIEVRYKDGGEGTIFGITRFTLPNTAEEMLKIQKKFRSKEGLANKLFRAHVNSVMQNTAGLMDSDESYAERRGQFDAMAKDQVRNGNLVIETKEVIKFEDGKEHCKLVDDQSAVELKAECSKAKRTRVLEPFPKEVNGQYVYAENDLEEYGIVVPISKVVDWGYEPKTLEQIALKREETMAAITAVAAAQRAQADTIKVIEQGKKNVATAKYEKEVKKIEAVVLAQQKVEVAREARNEAEQKKLAALEYKQEQILIGEGDAERNALVVEAGATPLQKLKSLETIHASYADALGQHRLVPDVNMGTTGADASQPIGLADLLMTKLAKDLNQDLSVK